MPWEATPPYGGLSAVVDKQVLCRSCCRSRREASQGQKYDITIEQEIPYDYLTFDPSLERFQQRLGKSF